MLAFIKLQVGFNGNISIFFFSLFFLFFKRPCGAETITVIGYLNLLYISGAEAAVNSRCFPKRSKPMSSIPIAKERTRWTTF